MNFLFALILLIFGSFFLLFGLSKTTGESGESLRFDTSGRIVATLVGLFMVMMAMGCAFS
jgi:hypothetical protein